MNKKTIHKLFVEVMKEMAAKEPKQQLEELGAVIGLAALAIERDEGVDRSVVFKMLQRHGYAAIKEMENATANTGTPVAANTERNSDPERR